MTKEIKVDITNHYQLELLEIQNKLTQLENGRVMEISRYNGDGSLAHNVTQLKKMIASLLCKIQYGKESQLDELSVIFEEKK